MKCAIHQPQFLPWLGHFQKINMADVFVFLDTVQFKKNEFQNRNRIRTSSGWRWVTVPVSVNFGDPIRAVRVSNGGPWRRKIQGALEHSYGRTRYFRDFMPELREILAQEWAHLADLNIASTRWLMDCFGINTTTLLASDLPTVSADQTGRLVDICQHLGADTYISGSLAKCYLDVEQFTRRGLRVVFQCYDHPVYPQPGRAAFESHMSAVDGLFNCGGRTPGRRALRL